MSSPTLRAAAGTLAFALAVTLAWTSVAGARPDNGGAAITGAFSDGCRDFAAHAESAISFVELHHADGRVVRDESVDGPDYALDGSAGDELERVLVKAGRTKKPFSCEAGSAPPTAVLELETPAVDQTVQHCYDFGGLLCQVSSPRTTWTATSAIPAPGLFMWGCGAFVPCPATFSVDFRGTSSSDPDGDLASWSLTFGEGTSAGGAWSAAPPARVSHVYGRDLSACRFPSGPCVIVLTVTDAAGQSDSETVEMAVVDQTLD
jgi:hypothetical protein